MKRSILLAAWLLVIACGSKTADKPADGAEGGACEHDAHCETGLVCASGLCVRPPTADMGGLADAATQPDLSTPADQGQDAIADSSQTDLGSDGGSDVSGGGEPPTCVISSPIDASTRAFFAEIDFVATATDPEDGPLDGAAVAWSSDLFGALGSGASLTRTVELAGTHVIRCTATDSDGNVGFAEVSIEIFSPIARIFHPATGETRTAGSMIPFVGRGDDAEDGQLTGASLVWTSSIDGQFGTGETFDAPLSAGMNIVTLTVTDADGNSGQTSITLNMVP